MVGVDSNDCWLGLFLSIAGDLRREERLIF